MNFWENKPYFLLIEILSADISDKNYKMFYISRLICICINQKVQINQEKKKYKKPKSTQTNIIEPFVFTQPSIRVLLFIQRFHSTTNKFILNIRLILLI